MSQPARVLVYGAGFTGLSLAHRLAVHHGVRSVMMVDPVRPLAMVGRPGRVTYRNWWVGADEALVRLANRTIDLLEDLDHATGGEIRLDRRGDLLVTTSRDQLDQLRVAVGRLAQQGLGPLREHQSVEWYLPSPVVGTRGVADGTDLLGSGTLRSLFPFLSPLVAGGVHSRRAGSLDGGRVARWLWQGVVDRGVEVRRDDVVAIDRRAGGGSRVTLASGALVGTDIVVLAPGARFAPLAGRLALSLPLFLESEPLFIPAELDRVVPNDCPNLVSVDQERLDWSGTEEQRLERDPRLKPLLFELPGGFELDSGAGSPPAASWGMRIREPQFQWPPVVPSELREAMVRVLVRLIPGAIHSRGGGRGGTVSGSYTVVTEDRYPLFGPLSNGPIFWLGGFGRMAPSLALGAADLLARVIVGEALPPFAQAFSPDRFLALQSPGSRAHRPD